MTYTWLCFHSLYDFMGFDSSGMNPSCVHEDDSNLKVPFPQKHLVDETGELGQGQTEHGC